MVAGPGRSSRFSRSTSVGRSSPRPAWGAAAAPCSAGGRAPEGPRVWRRASARGLRRYSPRIRESPGSTTTESTMRSGSDSSVSPNGRRPARQGQGPGRFLRAPCWGIDHFSQYKKLSKEKRKQLVIVDHGMIRSLETSFRWAVKSPPWLMETNGVGPFREGMQWVPLITFVQIMVERDERDARSVPGQFKSFGHDYRGRHGSLRACRYQLDDAPPTSRWRRSLPRSKQLKPSVARKN